LVIWYIATSGALFPAKIFEEFFLVSIWIKNCLMADMNNLAFVTYLVFEMKGLYASDILFTYLGYMIHYHLSSIISSLSVLKSFFLF
jgi:hypothetical protein